MRSVFPYMLLVMVLASGCANLAPEGNTELVAATPSPQSKAIATRPFPEDTFFDLLVAEMALRYRDLDTALDNYSYQADKTGDLGVITTTARLAQYLNRDEAAQTYAGQWLQREPENPEAHYIMASALSRSQRPLDAFPHMTKVMELGGESNFAALAATVLSQPDEEQQRFLQLLNSQLERYPSDNSLKIAKALILQYQQQESAALELVQQVLNDEPDNAHALLIETRTLAQLGRDDDALKRLHYAVDQNPNHKRLRHDLARRLVKTDLHQAKAQYELLVRQNPKDNDLLLELMLINRELSNTGEAAKQLESLSDTPAHSSRAHYVLGRLAEEDRNWTEALAHYEQAIADPEFTPASQRLTAISLNIDGAEKTLARLQLMRQQLPEHSSLIYMLEAEILRKEAQYQRGYDLLSAGLANTPDDEQLLYARSLFSEKLGNIDAVETDLRRIIKRDPENATALNALGYSLASIHTRLDEAETLVKRALAIEPEDPAIIDSYGWILFLKGDISRAVAILEKAYTKTQDHEIAAHFGEALWASGDQQRAKTVWKAGLKDTPGSPIIFDTLRRLKLLND